MEAGKRRKREKKKRRKGKRRSIQQAENKSSILRQFQDTRTNTMVKMRKINRTDDVI